MINMKAILIPFALAFTAPSASAYQADPQLRFFATCAGRLSALMEHQWNYDTKASETTSVQRRAMIDLTSAIMPTGEGREVLLMRIEAKHAQAGLLRRAVNTHDPQEARWAEARSDALVSECTSILLAAGT